jgi:hypothetical protein
MGKVLRFILILISILLVGFLVLCAVTDSEVKMEHRTTINASKAVVWEQIANFKNWMHWSSWKEQDTTIVVDYSGTDGQVGSKYHYVGKHIGEGTCTNTGLTDGEMKYEMDFVKPFPGKADGYYKVVEEAGKTTVIMSYHQNMGFLMRGMFAIMGKGMLEKMFDRGLELMKEYCETHAADIPANSPVANNITITETDFTAHTYAGIKGVVKWADMHNFFGNAYALVGKAAGQNIAGPGSALYWTWDTTKMETSMMACFPMKDDKPVKGATIEKVAAGKAYMIHYVGSYGGFMAVHNALHAKLTADKKEHRLVVEEYLKTPENETDSNKYETNVYYLLK